MGAASSTRGFSMDDNRRFFIKGIFFMALVISPLVLQVLLPPGTFSSSAAGTLSRLVKEEGKGPYYADKVLFREEVGDLGAGIFTASGCLQQQSAFSFLQQGL